MIFSIHLISLSLITSLDLFDPSYKKNNLKQSTFIENAFLNTDDDRVYEINEE